MVREGALSSPQRLYDGYGFDLDGTMHLGAKCEVNVGKPDPIMLDTLIDVLGLEMEDCLMTGDRLYTNIRMAKGAGMPSAVVLAGDTKAEDLQNSPEDAPEYVLERIDHLIPAGLRADFGWQDD